MSLLLSLLVSSRLKTIFSEIISPFCQVDICLLKSLRKAAINAVYRELKLVSVTGVYLTLTYMGKL